MSTEFLPWNAAGSDGHSALFRQGACWSIGSGDGLKRDHPKGMHLALFVANSACGPGSRAHPPRLPKIVLHGNDRGAASRALRRCAVERQRIRNHVATSLGETLLSEPYLA